MEIKGKSSHLAPKAKNKPNVLKVKFVPYTE